MGGVNLLTLSSGEALFFIICNCHVVLYVLVWVCNCHAVLYVLVWVCNSCCAICAGVDMEQSCCAICVGVCVCDGFGFYIDCLVI